MLDFMKLCEILSNFMKSSEILLFYETQQISFQIWQTSGGFQIMQILFRFTTDFICRFLCGLHYGLPLWTLWISYETRLFPYERSRESQESHLNQLLLLISGGFMKSNTILLKPKWFHEISNDFMKSNWILQKVRRIRKIHRSS